MGTSALRMLNCTMLVSVLMVSAARASILPDWYEHCLEESSDPDRAIKACTELLDSDWTGLFDSVRSTALHNRGVALLRQGKMDRAIADFSGALKIDPEMALAYFNRGLIYSERGDADLAIADFGKAIQLKLEFPTAYISRAELQFRKGNLDEAYSDYALLVERFPDFANPETHLLLSSPFMGGNDRKYADFRQATGLKNELVEKLFKRGNNHANDGLFDKAIVDYSAVIELDRKHKAAFRNRGFSWMDIGEMDRAIEDFDKVILIDPKDDDAFVNRGIAWSQKGDIKKAMANYDEAIRKYRYNYRAFLNRGKTWADMGDLDKAFKDYEAALKLEPDYAVAHNNLAWKMASVRDPKYRDEMKAVEHAEKAVHFKGNAHHRDTLAAAYAAVGRFDDAIREGTRALAELKPRYKPAAAARLEFYKQGKALYCPGGPECD